MTTAVVLINVKRGSAARVCTELAEMEGVVEVFSVAGRYDAVVLLGARDSDQLAELVSGAIAGNEEITRTETLIAFKAFSQKDLQSMFSIGMET